MFPEYSYSHNFELELKLIFSRELEAPGNLSGELSGGNCRSWSENVYSKLFLDPGKIKTVL